MPDHKFENLRAAIQMRGGSMPAIKSPEFFALIDYLFSQEEADLAVAMPIMPASAEEIGIKAGVDAGKVRSLLETMADKGLVYTFDKNSLRFYSLLPLLPGIFEMQFLSGDVSERAVRLAHLFEDYFQALDKYSSSSIKTAVPFPVARVISVEKEIPATFEIHPYDKVSQYIDMAEYIAVGTCYCRHHGELLGRPCTKPKEVCMGFGPDARFMAERKFGRLISKDEARDILRRTEEAGLVHCSSNMSKYVQFVCNCCSCHCGILQSMKKFNMKGSAAVSGFITAFDADSCIACGDCVERCPMEALTMKDDRLLFDSNRCIGCGLCSSTCPSGSLKLVERDNAPVPPNDWRQLNASLLSSVSELLEAN
ncbi:MAG: 4Fe-4S dicluster domain-containing protein [Dehalococcoidia bacterium]|jgi:ferredoxin